MARLVNDAVEKWVNQHGGGKYCSPNGFQIIFPTDCGSCDTAIHDLRKTMSQLFGGTTEWKGHGCWYDANGNEVCEGVQILQSAHNCSRPDQAKQLGEAIIRATTTAKQDAVFIAAGHKFYILPKEALGIKQ